MYPPKTAEPPSINIHQYYLPTIQRSLLQNAFVSAVRPISGIKSLKWTSDNVINRVTKKLALLHSAEKLFEGPVDVDDDGENEDDEGDANKAGKIKHDTSVNRLRLLPTTGKVSLVTYSVACLGVLPTATESDNSNNNSFSERDQQKRMNNSNNDKKSKNPTPTSRFMRLQEIYAQVSIDAANFDEVERQRFEAHQHELIEQQKIKQHQQPRLGDQRNVADDDDDEPEPTKLQNTNKNSTLIKNRATKSATSSKVDVVVTSASTNATAKGDDPADFRSTAIGLDHASGDVRIVTEREEQADHDNNNNNNDNSGERDTGPGKFIPSQVPRNLFRSNALPLSPYQAQANPHRRLQRFYGKILKKMILAKNKRVLERTRNAFVLMKADFDLSEMSYEVSCQEFADALNHQRNVLIEEERSHRRILENIEHESFEIAWNNRSGKDDNSNNNSNNCNNNAEQEYVFDTRKVVGEQNANPTETTIPRYQSPLHHARTNATASKTALIRLPINDKIKRQEQQPQWHYAKKETTPSRVMNNNNNNNNSFCDKVACEVSTPVTTIQQELSAATASAPGMIQVSAKTRSINKRIHDEMLRAAFQRSDGREQKKDKIDGIVQHDCRRRISAFASPVRGLTSLLTSSPSSAANQSSPSPTSSTFCKVRSALVSLPGMPLQVFSINANANKKATGGSAFSSVFPAKVRHISMRQQLQQHSYATSCHIEDDILKELVEIGSPTIVSSFLETSPSVFDAKFSCARYPGRFKPIQQIGKGTYGTAYLVVYRENKALIEEQKLLLEHQFQENKQREEKMQKRQDEISESKLAKDQKMKIKIVRKKFTEQSQDQQESPMKLNVPDLTYNNSTRNDRDARSASGGLLIFDDRFQLNNSSNSRSNNNNDHPLPAFLVDQAGKLSVSTNASFASPVSFNNNNFPRNQQEERIKASSSSVGNQQKQHLQQQQLHDVATAIFDKRSSFQVSASSSSASIDKSTGASTSSSSEIISCVSHASENAHHVVSDASVLQRIATNPITITVTDESNTNTSNSNANNNNNHSQVPALPSAEPLPENQQSYFVDTEELRQRLEHVQNRKMLQHLEQHCGPVDSHHQQQHATTENASRSKSRQFTSFRNKFSDMQRKSKRLLPIAGPAGAVSAMAASTEAISVNVTVRVGSNNNNNNNNDENSNSNQHHNNKNSSNAGGKATAHPPPVTTAVRQLKFSRDVLFVCKVEKLISPDILKSKQKVRDRMALPDYDSDFLDDNGDIIEDEEEYKKKQQEDKKHPSQIMFGGRRSSAGDSNSNSNNNHYQKSPKRAKQNDGEKKLLAMEANKKRLERMQNEADILSNIAHPNIVAFVDYFFDKKANQQLLFLEYVDGGDLRKDIEKRSNDGPRFFTIESVLHIFVQIVLAVEYLHRHNILHRDIKSQNILISKHYFAKLTDFGTSKQFDQDVDGLVDNKLVGTPLYISPELVAGKPYSQKSDIWALGVLLFELLNFDYPFLGETFHAIGTAVRSSPPRLYSRQVPAEIVDLVSRMLEKDPEMRPTAAQVLTEFPAMKIAAEYYEGRLKKFAASETSTKVDSVWLSVLSEHLDLLYNRSGKFNLLKHPKVKPDQSFAALIQAGMSSNTNHSNFKNWCGTIDNSHRMNHSQHEKSIHHGATFTKSVEVVPHADEADSSESSSTASSSQVSNAKQSNDGENKIMILVEPDTDADDDDNKKAITTQEGPPRSRRHRSSSSPRQKKKKKRRVTSESGEGGGSTGNVSSSHLGNNKDFHPNSSRNSHHSYSSSASQFLDSTASSQQSRAHCTIVRGLRAKTRNLEGQVFGSNNSNRAK